MRCAKLLLMGAVVLAGTSGALAVTSIPLPPVGLMSIDAFGAFAEIFLEVYQPVPIGPGLMPGIYNNVAIGYSDDVDLVTPGNQPDFVLYTGAMSYTGANPTPPGTIIAIGAGQITDIFTGSGDFEDKTRGRLYAGGVIQSITTTASVSYNKGGLLGVMDPDPDPQLTFTVYNAYVQSMALAVGTPGVTGGTILTDFVLTATDGQEVHLDIWADATPDATLGAPTTGMPPGMRYLGVPAATAAIPELPVRDTDGTLLVNLNTGTYYDVNASGWGEIAFAGDPADDDHVFWSFMGNPESLLRIREIFNLAPGEFFMDASGIKVWISGPSSSVDPTVGPGFSIIGQFIPGMSLVPDPTKTDSGYGYGNALLEGDYLLTADFRFGGGITGAYDSDPRTFTFQQGEPGSIATLTQLQGELIPEPVTMAGLLLGLGGLVRYTRRRRLV